MQALVKPDDIVLVDRNCHKSHHYGLVLSGAHIGLPRRLPAAPVLDVRGGAAARDQGQLLAFRRAGKLDRVKVLLLTNCTFDGIVYNVAAGDGGVPGDQARPRLPLGRSLVRVRALRLDLPPAHRHGAAAACASSYRDAAYRERLRRVQRTASTPTTTSAWLDTRLMPDPDQVRVRVYVTHSTHKTLTACARAR